MLLWAAPSSLEPAGTGKAPGKDGVSARGSQLSKPCLPFVVPNLHVPHPDPGGVARGKLGCGWEDGVGC